MVRKQVHFIPTSDGRKIGIVEWIPEKKVLPYPLLFVHGYSQNHLTWDGVKGGIAHSLAEKGVHVFAVDLRGSGYSRFLGPYYFTFEDFIQKDIPAAYFLLRVKGYTKFVIAGHSLGGTVSYVWASQNPDKVLTVITFGSPVFYGKGVPLMRALGKIVFKLRERRGFGEDIITDIFKILVPKEPFMKAGGIVGISAYPIVKLKLIFNIWPLFPSYPRNFEGFAEYFEKLGPGFDFSSIKLLAQVLTWAGSWKILSWDGKINWQDEFHKITQPVLVIAGKLDKLAPPESVKPIENFVNSRILEYMEWDAGHLDIVEGKLARGEIADAVFNFLRKVAEL